jgi:signal transduction histidine kinase/ligand-binding sensor domain-containing protein
MHIEHLNSIDPIDESTRLDFVVIRQASRLRERRIVRGIVCMFVAFFIVLISIRPARALDPERALTQALLRKWQIPQGLPEPMILSLLQTRDGYLWLGTRSGLYHFDGVRFSSAHAIRENILERAWIQSLCEDHQQTLWLGTNGDGLIALRGKHVEVYGPDRGLPGRNVQCLLSAMDGTLWVGTDRGLTRWIGEKFIPLPAESALPFSDIRALSQTADGAIRIGGNSSNLCLWKNGSLATITFDPVPETATIQAIYDAPAGDMWIGTSAGLLHRDTAGREKLITRAGGLADDFVNCLAPSRQDSLWVGTRDGISRIQPTGIDNFRMRDGLSQSTVFTLSEDHEGNLWVGTKHGLNQFIDRRTVPLTTSEGLPSNDTGPLFQAADQTIWIGTMDEGLAQYDGRRCVTAVTRHEGLPNATINSLGAGNDGALWIGTSGGLCRWRDGRIEETFTTAAGLPSDSITCIQQDARNILWVGTAAGLVHQSQNGFVFPAGERTLLERPVLALMRHGSEIVVAAEGAGVYEVSQSGTRHLVLPEPGLRDVTALYQDREGSLWMGTRGSGLIRWKDGHSELFTVRDGLYDDEIFGIVSDHQDRLWMACSRGIFFTAREELLKFSRGELTRLSCIPFSPTDAQRTLECQRGVQPVVWRMNDGRIWFSTIHGVIIIDPEHISRSLPPPRVVIEDVQANGREMDPRKPLELAAGKANLSLRYTALSFASPTRISFRYQLEGFDPEWIMAGPRREAFYTNLPPGNYRFRVAAANLGGDWSESQSPLSIRIPPLIYETAWFWIVVGLVIAVAIGVALRLRLLQLQARVHGMLTERSRIARELHDTLMQGFAGVTMQMQALARRLPPNSAEREVLEDVIEDAGNCLREARQSVAGLRHASQQDRGLAASVIQAARQLTESHPVRLVLHVQNIPPLAPEIEYNVLRIAQESISNAVRHSAARTIDVSLQCDRSSLRLMVRDDGHGFAASAAEPVPTGHYGLIGMRERALQIHATLEILSEPGRGTQVRLELTDLAGEPSRNNFAPSELPRESIP